MGRWAKLIRPVERFEALLLAGVVADVAFEILKRLREGFEDGFVVKNAVSKAGFAAARDPLAKAEEDRDEHGEGAQGRGCAYEGVEDFSGAVRARLILLDSSVEAVEASVDAFQFGGALVANNLAAVARHANSNALSIGVIDTVEVL